MSKMALLRRIRFFARLSERDLEVLADHLHRRTYHRHTILFDKGSPAQTLYLIESGRVRVFIPSETGEELSMNVYGAGDVVGELCILDGLPRCASAMTMEESVALTLDREDLRRCVAASPDIAFAIMEVLSTRLRYSTEYAESLAFLDVYGRVASRLLELADRSRVGTEETETGVELTQEELATLVGATRRSVSKALGAFQDQGLIRLGRGRITILDREGLARRLY
jgi:CRP/FNR family cyclic AMP-dependent transcriptional regulator